jgi:hypothetical protein
MLAILSGSQGVTLERIGDGRVGPSPQPTAIGTVEAAHNLRGASGDDSIIKGEKQIAPGLV